MAADITPAETALPMGWRLKLGFVLFPFALIPYGLLAPIVCYDRPPMTVASLVGTGVILQKMLLVSAIAVLGKPGFAFLKQRLFSRIAPPNEVGPTRYQIGLIMFCLPILQGFLNPYASQFAPDLVKNRFWINVLMDTMQVASVFVLGGNFWDKLRALFVRDARVVFPDPAKQILRICCKVGGGLRKRRGRVQIRPQSQTGPRRRRPEPACHPRQCSEPAPF